MRFEHFALNVPDARAVGRWYVEHLGFVVAREHKTAPFTHFLADDSGKIVVELYTNPTAAMTDFRAQHPLMFHIALVSGDARADQARLEKAGATFFSEEVLADGSVLIFLRDPWGIPLQFCQRAVRFAGY